MQNPQRIREINDHFRSTFTGGRVVITASLANRPDLGKIIERVRTFDAFDPDNDPWHEHDLGGFKIGETDFLWKIDYYAPNMESGSEDPADCDVTCRVLTVMLAVEY